MEQFKINYADIISLGFNEEECDDSVYFNMYGYQYVIITKDLTNKIYLDWEKESRFCYLVRATKSGGDIKGKRLIKGLEDLKETINFYTNNND